MQNTGIVVMPDKNNKGNHATITNLQAGIVSVHTNKDMTLQGQQNDIKRE